MRIALLGTGVMGSALLTSIVAAEGVSGVMLLDARPAVAREVAASASGRVPVGAASDLAEAVADADVVVVAVKPQHVGGLLEELAPVLPAGALVVSVAAGVTTAFLTAALPAGTDVVRVMPNTPATIGQGVSAISPAPGTPDQRLDLVEQLFAGTGLVVRVPESLQSVVTGVSGSGPAYVFAMIDALAEAGTAGGLPRDLALRLAAHTVAGSGAYAVASGQHPTLLREAVSSPGGTTLAGLAELDDRAVRAAYASAVRAAAARADALAAELEGTH